VPRTRPSERDSPLGRSLADGRRARRLKQADVAAATGRSRSLVSRWEAGEIEPDLVDLGILCRLLRVAPDRLVALAADAGRSRGRRGGASCGPGAGRLLLRARLAAEVGVVELSRRARVSARRLARIEAGGTPSLAELGRLLRVLGIDPAALVAGGPSLDSGARPPRVRA